MDCAHLLKYFAGHNGDETPSVAESIFGKLRKSGFPKIEISRADKNGRRVEEVSNCSHSLKLKFPIKREGQPFFIGKNQAILIKGLFLLNDEIVHNFSVVVERLKRYVEGLGRILKLRGYEQRVAEDKVGIFSEVVEEEIKCYSSDV